MHSGLSRQFRLRTRVSLALVAAIMPLAFVFMFANLWVYQPLQGELRALSLDIEHRWENVARLQLALTRCAMPVSDYLIHGRTEERGEYLRLSANVESAFSALGANTPVAHEKEHQLLDSLRGRWRAAGQNGEQILQFDSEARRSLRAVEAMEKFDGELDLIVQASDELLEHVRAELRQARADAEYRATRLNWFIALAGALAFLITVGTLVYLNQALLALFAERVDASNHDPLPSRL